MIEKKVLKLKVGKVTWWIDREYLHLFSEFLNRESAAAGERPVKESALRSVTSLPLDWGETVLVIKRQRYPTKLALLKNLVVTSKGVAEWRMARALLVRGIPTCLPIAMGKRRRLGVLKETILVTKGLEEVCDLFQYYQGVLSLPHGPAQRRAKKELAWALADLLSRAHKAGVFHQDLNGGNILVRKDEGDGLSLFLIDLHRVKLGRPSFSKVVANLSQLGPLFQETTSRADRLRFLTAYLSGGRLPAHPGQAFWNKVRSLARAIERKSRRAGLNFYLSRDRRCLTENRDFTSFITGRLRAWVRRSHFCPEFKAFLCDLWGPTVVLKTSSRTTSGLIPYSGSGLERELYVKVQQVRGIRGLRYLFSPARPRRAWVAANGLLLRGIGTPLPLAYLRKHEATLRNRSLFVSESLPDAVRIEDYLRQFSLARDARKRFVAHLACTLERLHKRGVYHGDLKANNILVRKGESQEPELLLVDLDGVKFRRRVSSRQRVKDLARLDAALGHLFTIKERLFFFQLYEKGEKEISRNRKKLLGAITKLSQKKVLEKARAYAQNQPALG